jgi:hypothetical protein
VPVTSAHAPHAADLRDLDAVVRGDRAQGVGEHRVERDGELGAAVPDEEPDPPAGVVDVHAEVAGLLGQPGPVGWVVTPRMCTRRVACSMTKNAYSRCR